MTDEELKHQELFRRLEAKVAPGMPQGYVFVPEPNQVANAVLAASTWAVLALTCDIELFSQAHYRSSIEPDDALDPLWKDVFLFHWREESQHAILDELEWQREDARLDEQQRDVAVDELIGLVGAVDGIVQMQAKADAAYFARVAGRQFSNSEVEAIHRTTLAAYRWQYITSGVQDARFLGNPCADDHGRPGRPYQCGAGADRRQQHQLAGSSRRSSRAVVREELMKRNEVSLTTLSRAGGTTPSALRCCVSAPALLYYTAVARVSGSGCETGSPMAG